MEPLQTSFGGYQLEDLIEILERRRSWIAAGLVLGLLAGLAAWQLLPARYLASTTLLVEPQGVPESFVRSTITVELEARMATLRQRVTSHENLNTLIDRIGSELLDPSGASTREQLLRRIRRNLETTIEDRSRNAAVVEISYLGDDPEAAAEVVRAVAELYIDENRKDRTQQATSTADFLDQELERLRAEVAEREHLVREFRAEHLGALPSQLESNLAELDRLHASLTGGLQAQETLRHQKSLISQYADITSGLEAELNEARAELIDSRRRYTDEHPSVSALKSQIALLESRAAAEPRRDADRPVSPLALQEVNEIRVSLRTRQREERSLRERIALVQQRVDDTPRNEADLSALTRDYENLTATYDELMENRQDADLSRNLETAQMAERFKVLRPALPPSSPSWPDPLLVIPGGVAAGLGLFALLILGAELRHPAFHSVKRLGEQLGLPVFASIPELDPEQFPNVRGKRIDWRIVVHSAPESAAAEQYRGFLPFFLDAEGCRTVLVTSANAGDGKSMTCLNLACCLGEDLDRRVLVIDADMRRASMHKLVGTQRAPGLSDVLVGDAEFGDCLVNALPNVSVLPAGSRVRRIVSLLSGEAFSKMRERALEEFDVILIDSPPILAVTDTRVLRKVADRVVFVVRAGASPPAGVMRSLAELNGVAGIVFNRVSGPAFKRYYTYDAYDSYGFDEFDSDPEPIQSDVVPLRPSGSKRRDRIG